MGPLARITRLHVWIIAIVLTAIAVGCEWYFLVKPQQEAFEAAKGRYDAAEPGETKEEKEAGLNQRRKEAKAKLEDAKKQVQVAEAKWARYDRRLMPDINLSLGSILASKQLWNEQLFVLGNKLNKFLEADHNVQVVQSGITLPAPSTDPSAVNQKAFVFPLGTISVVGTFENVLRNVERWNGFDRLVLTDGLTLSGTSPQLQGTYTITTFLFTHGEAAGKTAGASTTTTPATTAPPTSGE